MRAMSREEAMAWRRGWTLLQDRELASLRSTSLEMKFQQLSALFEAARALGWESRSPEESAGVDRVRDRWIRLKQASGG